MNHDKRRLTKLPTTAGASRSSNDGTRADTSATRATPQNAPTRDQKASTTFPSGRRALSRYPRNQDTGRGSRCSRGAGSQGLMKRSMSTCHVLTSDRVICPCGPCGVCDMMPKIASRGVVRPPVVVQRRLKCRYVLTRYPSRYHSQKASRNKGYSGVRVQGPWRNFE